MAAQRAEPHRAVPRRLPAGHALNPAARARLAVEILAAYLQARRSLRHAPIASVLATLRSQAPPACRSTTGAAAESTLQEARRLGRAVARTLALVPGDTRCLARSLVLTRLLARRGIPARLVIGARTGPDFLAHAWVEHAGDPVLPAGDGSFARLVEL
jgi:Transglutaminase-like superfamily